MISDLKQRISELANQVRVLRGERDLNREKVVELIALLREAREIIYHGEPCCCHPPAKVKCLRCQWLAKFAEEGE